MQWIAPSEKDVDDAARFIHGVEKTDETGRLCLPNLLPTTQAP